MQVLASLTGQQINVNQLSRLIGVSSPTIKDWLSVLETSGLIYFLQSYAYLIKINDPLTLEANTFAGAFMETYVMNEIRKSYLNHGKEFQGMYDRDANQNEIDLVLLENV